MPKEFSRMMRVAALIQQTVGEIIRRDLYDTRYAWVTISLVEVSPDCKHAKVFFTVLHQVTSEEMLILLKQDLTHIKK